jgi:ParB-like chromosome segregation protein Spo0J
MSAAAPAIRRLALGQIEPNPYRDLQGHPLRREQVEHLKASIGSTGFWDGLLARPHPKVQGRYQLVFGHARMQAAIEAGIKEANQEQETE